MLLEKSNIMLRVTHIYAWGGGWSGAEAIMTTIARSADLCPHMRSHFVLAPARDGHRLIEGLRAAGAPVDVLPDVRPAAPAAILRARKEIPALVRAAGSEVAVFHSSKAHLLFAPGLRAVRIPLVYWAHGGSVRLYDERSARRSAVALMERWAGLIQPNLAICVSRFCAAELLPTLFPNPALKRDVIYAPVQPIGPDLASHERATIRRELDADDDNVALIQASRISPWKGHELLFDAFARIRDLPGWVYCLVGGPQTSAEESWLRHLRRRADSLGIAERIRFVGQRNDVPRLLQAADIHCQPNARPEPFSIGLVEAMSAGLPVAGTALGGSTEIVDESCGILVKPGDAEALAEALRSLIASPELRARMGAAARQRAADICEPATQLSRLARALADVKERLARKPVQSGAAA